jgi:hypothetical protein
MPNITLNLCKEANPADSHLTAFADSKTYGPINGTHPFWDKILEGVFRDDVSVLDLFNLPQTAARQIISDRVSYSYGMLYFDGDQIDDTLAQHIVRLLQDDHPDWSAFVKFLENLQQNPSKHSREQLYRFLSSNDFTITHDGLIVGYKAVNGTAPNWVSTTSGPAIVDGQPHTKGPVPNKIGSVVTMPRSNVDDNAGSACSVGLHVGSWAYFKHQFGANPKLEVHVNPRDVVSVPNDCNDSKVRVCRYKVIGPITEPYSVPVLPKPHNASIKLTMPPITHEAEATPVKVKHPTRQAFDNLKYRAKAQKKGLVTMGQRQGWTLIGDGTKREGWSV